MPNAIKSLALALSAAALTACGSEPADQNITIDNNVTAAAGAEIEALPADESSVTASEDLADGTIEASDSGAATYDSNVQ